MLTNICCIHAVLYTPPVYFLHITLIDKKKFPKCCQYLIDELEYEKNNTKYIFSYNFEHNI